MDKKELFLPFDIFMQKRKYRYNKDMFNNDIMYKAKIWKAHRQEYILICEHKKWFNEYEKINSEVEAYESRLKAISDKNKFY